MIKVISTEKIPIKLWLDDIDEGALKQAKNLANLPFAFKWIAIMPDAHQGFGMPIGAVLATRDIVIPNAVGVDIGCGMCAVKTSLRRDIEYELLRKILGSIRKSVPVGFKHHKDKMIWKGFNDAPDLPVIQQELHSAHYQLGTLGSGNHFIEIQKGKEASIWIMVHSGSRNFGLKIAHEFHKKAVEMSRKWHSKIPDKDLSFLPADRIEAGMYLDAMNFAMQFARENRFRIIESVKKAFSAHIPEITFDKPVDIHHNYAAIEKHYGREVIVHRKGAISAREGQIGLIPGSQGTKSYIVKGKGNPYSFMSCSHGAGRKLGRKQAQRELDLKDQKQKLEKLGIIHALRNVRDLDEAPGAYKDISVVMKNQSDLVGIVEELSPVAVIKG
jgi:tRNA-splicing ligase RtcB